MAGTDDERIAQLEAENAKLRDRVGLLERRCGHLMVDADRREERALKQAGSCEYHGHEIQHLRHMADWCWAEANRQEGARQAIVSQLALGSGDGADFVLLRKRRGRRAHPGAARTGEVAGQLHQSAAQVHARAGLPDLR
jgi:hypothetical protein